MSPRAKPGSMLPLSTTSCSKDVTTDDSREGGSARTEATVSVQTARGVITSFVDRRQRRRRTRSIRRSIPTTIPAPMTNKTHGPPPQQQQQQQQQLNDNTEQQQVSP